MRLKLDIRWYYPDPSGRDCVCRLRLYRPDGLTVVIASDLPEGSGSDLARTSQYLAARVRDEFKIPSESLVWITHKRGRSFGPGGRGVVSDVFLVGEDHQGVEAPLGGRASGEMLTQQDVERMIGEPWAD